MIWSVKIIFVRYFIFSLLIWNGFNYLTGWKKCKREVAMRPLWHLLILIKVRNKYTTYQEARFCRFFLILFSPWTNDTKNNQIKVISSFLPTVKQVTNVVMILLSEAFLQWKLAIFLKCTDKTSHGQKLLFFYKLDTWFTILL